MQGGDENVNNSFNPMNVAGAGGGFPPASDPNLGQNVFTATPQVGPQIAPQVMPQSAPQAMSQPTPQPAPQFISQPMADTTNAGPSNRKKYKKIFSITSTVIVILICAVSFLKAIHFGVNPLALADNFNRMSDSAERVPVSCNKILDAVDLDAESRAEVEDGLVELRKVADDCVFSVAEFKQSNDELFATRGLANNKALLKAWKHYEPIYHEFLGLMEIWPQGSYESMAFVSKFYYMLEQDGMKDFSASDTDWILAEISASDNEVLVAFAEELRDPINRLGKAYEVMLNQPTDDEAMQASEVIDLAIGEIQLVLDKIEDDDIFGARIDDVANRYNNALNNLGQAINDEL